MLYNDNPQLIVLLNELNSKISKIDERDKVESKFPSLFVIGAPRTGSTLLTQWLASTQSLCYPTNFLSRFYSAPSIGVLIQEMLFNKDFQYGNEFYDIQPSYEFKSNYGKTEGVLAPHEFWYFWKRFFEFPEHAATEEKFKDEFIEEAFTADLNMLKNYYQKPVFMKGKIINFYLKPFAEKVENGLFLHMKREPAETIKSLLEARVKWTGKAENWFSWKPREINLLSHLSPLEQCVGQYYFIEKEIAQVKNYLGDRYIAVDYDEFCENPLETYNRIHRQIIKFCKGYSFPIYNGVEQFTPSKKLTNLENEEIKKILSRFENAHGFTLP